MRKTRNYGELGLHLQKIIKLLLANDDLVKLLYYTDTDPLAHSDLTLEQKRTEVYDKLIKAVPLVSNAETSQSLLTLQVINGIVNSDNKEFSNVSIRIEIFVPIVQWLIKNSNLRPLAIIGEIFESLNGTTISGLGQVNGGTFHLNFISEEMSCYYMIINITEYN